MKLHRNAARVIVINHNLPEPAVLVMERWRRDSESGEQLHYFSIPGGGIEQGETPAQAAMRELQEEMTIQVELGPEVAVVEDSVGTKHYYFVGNYVSGTPALNPSSPEAAFASKDDTFKPGWLAVSQLESAGFYPIYRQVLPSVQDIAQGKIPSSPWQIRLNDL